MHQKQNVIPKANRKICNKVMCTISYKRNFQLFIKLTPLCSAVQAAAAAVPQQQQQEQQQGQHFSCLKPNL